MNSYEHDLDQKAQDLLNQKVADMEAGKDPLNTRPRVVGETSRPIQVVHTDMVMQPDNIFPANQERNIKEEIKRLEEDLRGSSDPRKPSLEMETFRDSSGNETFYVKNISGRHVLITDIGKKGEASMDKIKIGEVIDLTDLASMEDLKSSKDLRKAVRGDTRTLERLTEVQYLEELRRASDNKKKIDILKRQEALRSLNPQQQNQFDNMMPHERPALSPFAKIDEIKPAIQARLGKLGLRSARNPEDARLAMTGLEFIQWVQSASLSHAEIDHIMGHPAVVNDHDIRAALLDKKRSTPPE